MLELIKKRIGLLYYEPNDVAEVKIVRTTNYEWWVSKDDKGQITGLNMKTAVGYKMTNGDCYMRQITFRRDYLGGGQYQETMRPYKDFLPSPPERIACATLDAAVQEDESLNETENKVQITPVVPPNGGSAHKPKTAPTD